MNVFYFYKTLEWDYNLDGCLEDILDQWIQDYPQVATKIR
jgi:hypothetical protein